MSKIDLTKDKQESIIAIEKIKFHNWNFATYSHETAQQLQRSSQGSQRRKRHSTVNIVNTNDLNKRLMIENIKHAKALVKALELCIELKWLK